MDLNNTPIVWYSDQASEYQTFKILLFKWFQYPDGLHSDPTLSLSIKCFDMLDKKD